MTREELQERLYDMWCNEINYKAEPSRLVDEFCDNVQERYEVTIKELKDCAEFSTKQALEINQLKKICEGLVNMPKGQETHEYSDYKEKGN